MSETLLTIRIDGGPTTLPEARKWLDQHHIDGSTLVGIEIPAASGTQSFCAWSDCSEPVMPGRTRCGAHLYKTEQSKGSPCAFVSPSHGEVCGKPRSWHTSVRWQYADGHDFKQAYRLPATAVQHMMVSLFGSEHDEDLVPDAIECLKDFDVEIIGEPK